MSLLARICASAWSIEPAYAEKILAVVERHDAGVKLEPDAIRSAIGRPPKTANPRDRAYEIHQGIAIIPVQGVLEKHAANVTDISGPSGTSYEQILTDVRTALADPEVRSLLLHIESPGGAADAMAETSGLISDVGAVKTVWSLIDGLGASAGYGLAIAGLRVYATPSAMVGSIGTMMMMRDTSAAAEKAGVKTRVVRSAPLKGGVAPGEPITDLHLADKQRLVDGLAAQFYALVGARRNLTGDALAAVTDGRVHLAPDAKALGLIDGISSLEQVLAVMTDPTQITRPAIVTRHPTSTASTTTRNTMIIDPQKLVSLQEAHPAHSALIGRMAVGHADKAPASEADIVAAIQAADIASAKVALTETKSALAKAEGDLAAAATAHATAIAAKDVQIAALTAERDEAKAAAGKRGVPPVEATDQAEPALDAVAAYDAKIAELKKAGDRLPQRTIATKHPELQQAYLAASQPKPQKGATK